MTFLALIIALGLMQYWGSAAPLHRDGWFWSLSKRLARPGLAPQWQLAAVVLPPALLVQVALALVSGWLFGAVTLALTVAVLLYSFGRGNLDELVGAYRERCGRGDFEAAWLFAGETLPTPVGDAAPEAEGPEQVHGWVKRCLGYLGFERWFAVVFYLALLGAPGALAYRLLHLHAQRNDEDEAQRPMIDRVLHVVDWVPARLLVLTFAVTGDWVGGRGRVVGSLRDTQTPAPEVIAGVADAALGGAVPQADGVDFSEVADREASELHSLLRRSAVVWLVVLSLLVLVL